MYFSSLVTDPWGRWGNVDPYHCDVKTKDDIEKVDGIDFLALTLQNYRGKTTGSRPQDHDPDLRSKGDYYKSLTRSSSKSDLYGSSRMEADEDGDLVSVNDEDVVLDLVEDHSDIPDCYREITHSPHRG